jgi:two-component system C4-dicarboxylate transport sensor histidine kinase DctB
MAVLSVEDSGGGIPKEALARVFEPFFTTKPVGKGTGLGLSISFGLATELGGDLTVRNASRGARFELRLPLAAPDQPAPRAGPAARTAS